EVEAKRQEVLQLEIQEREGRLTLQGLSVEFNEWQECWRETVAWVREAEGQLKATGASVAEAEGQVQAVRAAVAAEQSRLEELRAQPGSAANGRGPGRSNPLAAAPPSRWPANLW